MPYDVDSPAVRYNTDISREHFGKYRVINNGKSIYSRFNPWKGNDGDLFEKARFGLVYGSFPAILGAVHSNSKHRGQFTVMSVTEKSFRHGTPWLISGVTYGITVGLLTHIRKTEDELNHFGGGFAAGSMIGAWYKWPKLGFWTGMFMGVAAGLIKHVHITGDEYNMGLRRQRVFNMYRRGWFTERPDAEGRDDAELDVSYREYRP